MEIHLNYDGTYVRLFFRILFFVLFVVVSFFGAKCCTSRVKLHLLRGRQVPVTQMTGWLQNFDALIAIKTIRSMPGSWLGILMILSVLLNLASDFVSTAIQKVTVRDRCRFGTGMVMGPNPILTLVPWNGKPYTVASQAQIISQANGGLKGVYVKVNQDPNFSADVIDVLAGWECIPNPTQLRYSPDVTPAEITADVQQHGFLYDLTDPPYTYAEPENPETGHVVIWDTSEGLESDQLFNVRASIDLSAGGSETKIMQSYECKLESSGAKNLMDSCQRVMSSRETLQDWTQVMQGSMYDGSFTPASNNTRGILEEVLNSLIMIEGGNNYLLNTTAADETQGCLSVRTYVPWEVVALALVVLALTAFMIAYWLYLSAQIWSVSRGGDQAHNRLVKTYTPGDVFTWMAQAVWESQDSRGQAAEKVKPKRLAQWQFGESADGKLGFTKTVSSGSVELRQFEPLQQRPYQPAQQHQQFEPVQHQQFQPFQQHQFRPTQQAGNRSKYPSYQEGEVFLG